MSESTIWIWGRRPVVEALRAGGVVEVLLAEGRKPAPILAEIRRRAGLSGVVVRSVSPSEIDRLAHGQNAQGVAAQVVERRLGDVRDLLARILPGQVKPFVLVLDQLQDPHNVGALLRTADAAGVQGVVMPERGGAPISGAVARVSAGAVSHLPIVEAKNLARALTDLSAAGFWIAGLDGAAKQAIFEADFSLPIALVVGSEGEGLRRLTRERCDFLVRIPMFGAIQSLNASVAGSLAMYEVVRQRRFGRRQSEAGTIPASGETEDLRQ